MHTFVYNKCTDNKSMNYNAHNFCIVDNNDEAVPLGS